MIFLEQKYTTLLDSAGAKIPTSIAGIRLCFEVLALASAIDRDCAVRLGAHGLSEGRFVLLFLLGETKDGLSPH
ncbi:MAG: MarR family transcriptional regulator, partial [Xanthomonadaceae bacterium]|nr:MarR family transcriptional regulator [Xanthomonadaceae bacterium]